MVDKLRLYFQMIFLIFTNINIKGFIRGTIYKGKLKNICLPGLNCYSCPGAIGSCPIGSLQGVIASRNYTIPFYVLGFLIFFGSIFGRFVCGWMCPFGWVQDIIYKIPFIKKINNFGVDKHLRYLKYLILSIFVIILPLFVVDIVGQGRPWFCEYICPSGTLFAGIPLVFNNRELSDIIGFLYYWKLGVLIFLLWVSIIVYRPFCKYICPLGVIYGFFNRISLFNLDVNKNKCIDCKKCENICAMRVEILKNINSVECIRCGKCKDVCPVSAINLTCGQKNILIKNDELSRNV
ncbi:MAG: 4Fe-4S binding protein [Fusobacteriaceae bacterium]|nr:4Fe-4S binding protein [Fusobacteriaceae bacterium]